MPPVGPPTRVLERTEMAGGGGVQHDMMDEFFDDILEVSSDK